MRAVNSAKLAFVYNSSSLGWMLTKSWKLLSRDLPAIYRYRSVVEDSLSKRGECPASYQFTASPSSCIHNDVEYREITRLEYVYEAIHEDPMRARPN